MTDIRTQTVNAAPHAIQPHARKKEPNRDPRYLALRNFALSMSVFNVLGYTLLGFEQPWLWPVICVPFAYVVEMVLEVVSAWAQERRPRFLGGGFRGVYEFLLPSHITALAVNMLLFANNQLLPVLLGVFIGVAGKHVLQAPINGRMRHYMNPSNFGITVSLLMFGSWISIAPPYEFTENANTFFRVGIPLVIATAGTVINAMLTKRVPLIVGWLGGFVIQAVLRHFLWDVAIWSALGPMSGVAFVLFTNYMITDPGTTPSKGRNQFMFGSSVAMVYGLLMLFNVVYTLFFATTIVCAVRGIGWWVAHALQRRRGNDATNGTVAQTAEPQRPANNEAVAA
ncbi:enediyne biosynthesis protein [Streptomyces laculatispora]|uniref:Enediyne biosynthesis protein n=1 Tax=Streptomyces laculatispora TaxID=887464 RepID=A0ABY9IFW0_9ACTN|nr:enediyne biosynthesis protein [Streptomyces laculatispora]WLQ45089.1 enediyne biosynthesis protein [Streptomyces laculatispora]